MNINHTHLETFTHTETQIFIRFDKFAYVLGGAAGSLYVGRFTDYKYLTLFQLNDLLTSIGDLVVAE